VSLNGLLRTEAEVWRASRVVNDTGEVELEWSLASSPRCSVRRVRGGAARGPAGETISVDLVAYFPPGTELRPEGPGQTPDRIRIAGRDHVCVFVDRGSSRGAPVKAGLRLAG